MHWIQPKTSIEVEIMIFGRRCLIKAQTLKKRKKVEQVEPIIATFTRLKVSWGKKNPISLCANSVFQNVCLPLPLYLYQRLFRDLLHNQGEAVDDPNVKQHLYQGESGFAALSTTYKTNATSVPTNMT